MSSDSSPQQQPAVLILGGTGFIGRNLVRHLVSLNLASLIRVADKTLPATAYLSPSHKSAFDDPRVEFKQANLTSQASVEKIFTRDNGQQFDYVFNLAAETKYGLSESVYDEKVYALSVNVGKEAAKRQVKVFVEMSTAQVYQADSKPSDENSKLKPWTLLAKAKLRAEEELKTIKGLNLIIVRPSCVYGPGDILGITPRLIIGAVYRQLKEEMKLLWTRDLKLNTVHVVDVCRALWAITTQKSELGSRTGPVTNCEIYNLSDDGDTDQGSINSHLQAIFDIQTGFQGTLISQFAKLNLDSVVEDVNDKHLQPWSDLCKAGGINTTPLTPFLDKELLKDNSLSVDGTKIVKTFVFNYSVPTMTTEKLNDIISEFVATNIWPKGTTNK